MASPDVGLRKSLLADVIAQGFSALHNSQPAHLRSHNAQRRLESYDGSSFANTCRILFIVAASPYWHQFESITPAADDIINTERNNKYLQQRKHERSFEFHSCSPEYSGLLKNI